MSEGFLGRWVGRKAEAEPTPVPSHPPVPAAGSGSGNEAPPPEGAAEAERAPPTLEEAQALTPASDFTRFTAPDVAPEVKNAALKKLFTDPRYNVQDGLDVYIGDYSQPDPLPESMLRQLASAKFLGLFKDEEDQAADATAQKDTSGDTAAAALRDDADDPAAQSVAQSDEAPPAVTGGQESHADADLRLQQDDAAPGAGPGHGTGREPGAA